MDMNEIYYDKFLQFVVEYYSDIFNQSKPGHCMKITGLAIEQLEVLIGLIRMKNADIETYILSEEKTGMDYIRATKLIELRNNCTRPLLVLIPTNSRTSAEDSYGDATFQNLAVADLQIPFLNHLQKNIPDSRNFMWADIRAQILSYGIYDVPNVIAYLLFVESEGFTKKAWGKGLYLLGMIPDSVFMNDMQLLGSRFFYNLKGCAEVLADFSLPPADRISKLPLKPETIQKDLMSFLEKEKGINDRMSICAKIYESYPNLDLEKWPLKIGAKENVIVYVDIVPGKDPTKELVNNDGNLELNIPKNKKGKITFVINTNPAPSQLPKMDAFCISLVNRNDFEDVEVIKYVKITTNKKATRRLSVQIPNDMFEDGEYMLMVHAVDSNKLILDTDNPFKDGQIQLQWEERKKLNPDYPKEVFRQERQAAYSNESLPFSLRNSIDEDTSNPGPTQLDKRIKMPSFMQADIQFRLSSIIRGEDPEAETAKAEGFAWKEGSLIEIFHFDFDPHFAYQIQLSKKLNSIERVFLDHSGEIGQILAKVDGNPTEKKLQSIQFYGLSNLTLPSSLIEKRKELFTFIQDSAPNHTGVTATFDFRKQIGVIKEYISDYNAWLSEVREQNLSEEDTLAIQNIETALLLAEMPDGTKGHIKLISPLHPLRLGWMVNLCELYLDWEQKTKEYPGYQKAWYRKLDQLFYGDIPMDIAPIVLSDGKLKEPYQYVGELTFGWGVYVKPSNSYEEVFTSEARQMKAYVASLLNVTREKVIDSDVNKQLVYRHLSNYASSHPYTNTLVINLFNSGDSNVFADALVMMEQAGFELNYVVRLFADDSLIKPGSALRELINPEYTVTEEAEMFSQASTNRLFPKLRYSQNSFQDFIDHYEQYQAHLSFLVNPFQVKASLARPDDLDRSFYLNGVLDRSIVSAYDNGGTFIWNRYFSEKVLPNPESEFSNVTISLYANIMGLIGRQLSSTIEASVPATTLMLREADKMLLEYVHSISDWVVTFDKNMGPEFYDLPVGENHKNTPYLLDYIPGQETMGVSSYLTTRPTSEVESLMIPHFKAFGIDISEEDQFQELLEDVRTVSSSLIMQSNLTKNKAFEVLGITLTKRFLKKKGLLEEAFLIPIDLHKELFEGLDSEDKERADNLLVNIDLDNREIIFTVIEIKCRQFLTASDEQSLHGKILSQIENTILALNEHFSIRPAHDRLDRELKTLELRTLLEFYIRRAMRYEQLDPTMACEYLRFVSELDKTGYVMKIKKLGIIFNFSQKERQKKTYEYNATLFTMGESVIEEILSGHTTLHTSRLEEMDKEFCSAFEPNRKDEYIRRHSEHPVIEPEPDDPSVHIVTVRSEEGKKNDGTEAEIQPDQPSDDNQSVDSESEKNQEQEKPSTDVDVVDPNYEEPKWDLLIGKNEASLQYGILGKTASQNRLVAIDLNDCQTISLFGVQGAGKSYSIGSVVEMTLKQFSKVNKLPSPLASVIFHYSEDMFYAPEFTSMVYPNDEASQLAKLKAEFGAEPGSIEDVILLTPESQVEKRKSEYPAVKVYPIGFSSKELMVADWMFLLGASGNDSTYVKELKQIMKAYRNDMSLVNIRKGVADSQYLSNSQRNLANQKLDFAAEYIKDGVLLKDYMHPGRLIIVDLRDEFISKDEALGLFVVMLNIFASAKAADGQHFNKFIVFDEAHKYMNDANLVSSITTAIREMRHKGVSVMIASQDPMSLPNEIIELSSIVVLHRFSSPQWVKHVQKSITPLQTLTATDMSALGSGEAYLWANKATEKGITQRPIKITIRPRVTKHGGDTISAVK